MDIKDSNLLFCSALAGVFTALALPIAGMAHDYYVAKKMLEAAPTAKLVAMDRGLCLLDIDGKPGPEIVSRPNAKITPDDFKEMSGKDWLAKSRLLAPYRKGKFSD